MTTVSGRARLTQALEIVLVFGLAIGWLWYLQQLTPHFAGKDAYFHVKVAWLMRSEGLLDEFPWAQLSLWREAWFDKDFGFHVVLAAFTGADLTRGGKLAASFLGAVFVTSFYAVLRRSGLRWPWLWTLVLLSSGVMFLWRLNVTRPHLVSMTLSLWAMHFVLSGAWKRLTATTAVYALSYTAPHVAIGYAAVHAIGRRLFGEGRGGWKLVAGATGGILLGAVLHPHFPNNFRAWWLQNVEVLAGSWTRTGEKVSLAMELAPTDTRSFLIDHAVLYVAALVALYVVARGRVRFDARLVTLFVVANGFLVLTLSSKRFVEYLVPFAVWLLAEVIERGRKALTPVTRRGKALAAVAVAAVVLAFFGLTASRTHTILRGVPAPESMEAGVWLLQHAPADEVIFTCDWDDAPELFFVDHRHRYLLFLDPMYLYRWRPALWTAWRQVATGQQNDPVPILRDALGTRYGFCTNDFGRLRAQLANDPRARIVHQTRTGYVFEIDPAESK